MGFSSFALFGFDNASNSSDFLGSFDCESVAIANSVVAVIAALPNRNFVLVFDVRRRANLGDTNCGEVNREHASRGEANGIELIRFSARAVLTSM